MPNSGTRCVSRTMSLGCLLPCTCLITSVCSRRRCLGLLLVGTQELVSSPRCQIAPISPSPPHIHRRPFYLYLDSPASSSWKVTRGDNYGIPRPEALRTDASWTSPRQSKDHSAGRRPLAKHLQGSKTHQVCPYILFGTCIFCTRHLAAWTTQPICLRWRSAAATRQTKAAGAGRIQRLAKSIVHDEERRIVPCRLTCCRVLLVAFACHSPIDTADPQATLHSTKTKPEPRAGNGLASTSLGVPMPHPPLRSGCHWHSTSVPPRQIVITYFFVLLYSKTTAIVC